jgi:nicotinate phosphoribosyltransferase
MDEVSPLLTDLYQFTMLQGYFDRGMEETALFEFFVRTLPPGRNFLMAAGLEQLLDYLERLHFTGEEIEALSRTGRFSPGFLTALSQFRFTGEVDAVPEGTLFFPNEPIVRVSAPLPQAQLIETRLINLLHFQTLIASKAARMVLAAPGKLLFDFGLRRAHGAEAGLFAARAAYLAGMAGTATVLAGSRFGIPLFGTMAHSFIQAHDDESEAFLHFAESQPGNVVFLLDTYDTEAAAEKVVSLAPRLRSAGIPIEGVRLDSGDLAAHARAVRKILDAGGLPEVKILASGNLDEFALDRFLKEAVPIDGFGVGTRLDTSADGPYLDAVYKLQVYGGRPRRKRSEGKETWPGRKQVYRRYDGGGRMAEDLLSLEGERQEGEALLVPVMRGGRRLAPSPGLTEARSRAAAELARLPGPLRRLEEAPPYRVTISGSLRRLAEEVDRAG